MDIAAAGYLLIFFSLFVASILVGLLVLSYAAYSFFVTLTSTAAGNDEVIWPGEPITDWLFKIWYLGWVLAVWAVPASLLVGLFGLSRPLFALCLAGVLWLVFPVGLLSSLSASSRFIVLRPMIIALLLRRPGVTLRFYAGSALVILVCGALSYAALFGLRPIAQFDQPVIMVPLAAIFGGAGCLVYARLLGRLAFIISQSPTGRRKRHGQGRPAEADRVETFDPWSPPPAEQPLEEQRGPHCRPRKELPQKKKLRARKANRALDPWAIPPDEPIRKKTKPTASDASLPDDPYGPAEGTYEILSEAGAPPQAELPPKRSGLDQEEAEPYAVSAPSEGTPSRPPSVQPEVSKLEEELAAPRRLPPLPAWPWVTGVYSFPFYPQTVGACGTLMVGFLVLLGLLRLLLFVFPS
jgi:hypothetical protein